MCGSLNEIRSLAPILHYPCYLAGYSRNEHCLGKVVFLLFDLPEDMTRVPSFPYVITPAAQRCDTSCVCFRLGTEFVLNSHAHWF